MSSSSSFEGNFKKSSSTNMSEMQIEEENIKESLQPKNPQKIDIKLILDEVDIEDMDKICNVSLYAKQIFTYLHANEVALAIN
jgi:hypothetical protein